MITVLASSSTSVLIGNFILVTASFAILLILIRIFAWNNVTAIFQARADKIAEDIDSAEEKNKQAEALVSQREQELADSRVEGKQLIQDSVTRAKHEKQMILEQAKMEVDVLKEKATREIAHEQREAQENLRANVVELAVELAGKIIMEDLSEEAHQNLVNRYLDKLGEK